MGSPQTAALAWNLLLKGLFMGFSLLQATSTCSTMGSSTWHCQVSVSQYSGNRALPQNLLTSLNMKRLLHVCVRSYSFILEAVALPSRFCFIKKRMKKQKRLATCGLAFSGIALLSTKLFLVTEN